MVFGRMSQAARLVKMKPLNCGVDISLRKHKVCLLDEKQGVISKYEIGNDLEGFKKLEKDIARDTKICIEPTGIYSINFYLYFKNKGHDVRFCGTYSSKHFREAIYGRKKHDNLDSIALAKYRIVNEDKTFELNMDKFMCSVPEHHGLKTLLDNFNRISKQHAKLRQKVILLVDLRLPEAIKIYYKRFCKEVRTFLANNKATALKSDNPKHEKLKTVLKKSIGQFDFKIDEFRALTTEFDNTSKEKRSIEKEIKLKIQNHAYNTLYEVKGLDTISIASLIVEIGSVKRFLKYSGNSLNKKYSLKCFKKFIGLHTTCNQSGEKDGSSRMARFGNKQMKKILRMSTVCNLGLKDSKYKKLNEEWKKKKPKGIALTKTMSKFTTDLFFKLCEAEKIDLLLSPLSHRINI